MPHKTGCLFCNNDGCEYCQPPKHTWFRGGSKTQKTNVMRGFHPMGDSLMLPISDDRKCGNCARMIKAEYHNKTYIKCNLNYTHGMATDIRLFWPACVRWLSCAVQPSTTEPQQEQGNDNDNN